MARNREQRREGYTGYSRTNAGVYHERLEHSRSRGRIAALVIVLLAVAVAVVLGFSFFAGPTVR